MTTALTLFPIPLASVNVAAVPQRSPFRYAGGKTWFVPHLRRWLSSLPAHPEVFLEPFVGGGSLSCAVLVEDMAERVIMVELDKDVVSVWQTIFSECAPALAERIAAFELTTETVATTLAVAPDTTLDRAFQTILRNRVNRGGILAAGAGQLKMGENGRGLLSRWYPETLARRIMTLFPYRDRVTVVEGDGLAILEQHLDSPRTASLLDPPYTAGGKRAGHRLYQHSNVDHERLFTLCSQLGGPFLLTYDDSPEVTDLARRYDLTQRRLVMKNTHHAHLTELVLGRDLSWF